MVHLRHPALDPVGTYPRGDGKWGHSDLAGNVHEWALDWFLLYADPCTDCANLAGVNGDQHAIHGGAFTDTGNALRTSARFGAQMLTDRTAQIGVRCARPL